MLRVGLTGGIGSGKSAAASLFAARGAPVVDTDRITHDLTRPGQPAHEEIVRTFGNGVTGADGALDRAKLRAHVFSNPKELRKLESILHPRIREETQRQLDALNAPYAIVMVPLLVETNFDYLVNRILVVDCEETLQIQRTSARSGLTPDQVKRVMNNQARRADRLARANDVIDNGADLAHLEKQVDALHQRYLGLARD
jgi:dephospho-CoA kinase